MSANKKYYWLKLKDNFFEEDTIQFIEEQDNGILYSNFYLKLCLKALNTNGRLMRCIGNQLLPYDVRSLSKLTGVNVDTVRCAMSLFEQIGLIQILETGEIFLAQLDELIGSETDKAVLMRRKRAKEKLIGNNVTPMLPNCSDVLPKCYTEIDKETDKEIDKEIDKDKKTKKITYVSVINNYTSNESLKTSLKMFVKMRKEMRGFTVDSLVLNLKTLDELSNDDNEKVKIVNKSVERGWKTFFELNEKEKKELPDWFYNQDEDSSNNVEIDMDELNRLRKQLSSESKEVEEFDLDDELERMMDSSC